MQRIYDLYLNRIARFITSKGGSSEDAKDIFQDALIIIFEKAQAPKFTLSSQLYTFLYGICRNLWGNRLKKKRRSGVINSDDETYTSDEDIQATIEAEEENQVFWEAFDHLGADCQKLLQLFFEKKKMEEIKEIMGHGSVNYTNKKEDYLDDRSILNVPINLQSLKDNAFPFQFNANLRITPGLYYYIIAEKNNDDPLYVGKFEAQPEQ